MSAVSQKKVTFDWLFSNNINNSDKQSSETKINNFKKQINKRNKAHDWVCQGILGICSEGILGIGLY